MVSGLGPPWSLQVSDAPCSEGADPDTWHRLLAYDRLCFPTKREAYLSSMLLRHPAVLVSRFAEARCCVCCDSTPRCCHCLKPP